VDPKTGAVTTFASGLPPSLYGPGGGGVFDVAFIGHTAYALVIGVAEDLGGDDIVGIYRVDGPSSFTVVADLGAFNTANPPETDFFIPTGVGFALEPYRHGFLVTDGHLNRVLYVTLDGEIEIVISFSDIVVSSRALCTVASILARLRIIVWSFIKMSTSRSVIVATAAGSKSANARRSASRLLKTTAQDSPFSK